MSASTSTTPNFWTSAATTVDSYTNWKIETGVRHAFYGWTVPDELPKYSIKHHSRIRKRPKQPRTHKARAIKPKITYNYHNSKP